MSDSQNNLLAEQQDRQLIPVLPLRDVVRATGYEIDVIGPVMQEDGLRIHREFWPRPEIDSDPEPAL